MKKTIVFVKHDGDKKEYLFEVPEKMEVKHDDILLVDTIKGKQIARATGDMSTGDYTDDILLRLGAYLPLKRVLAVAGKEIIEYIEEVVMNDIIFNLEIQKQGNLPF